MSAVYRSRITPIPTANRIDGRPASGELHLWAAAAAVDYMDQVDHGAPCTPRSMQSIPSMLSIGLPLKTKQSADATDRYSGIAVPGTESYRLDLMGRIMRWLGPARRSRRSRRRRLQEIEQCCRSIPAGETIFVSVASYRDPQCPETVFEIFEKAACPSRIFVGVCQQNYGSDPDVRNRYRKLVARSGTRDFSDHIRVYHMSADRAQGPMLARHLIEQHLYRNEHYYLIIDAHTMFTPRWDLACIETWTQARRLSPKPILTMYPEGFKPFHRRWPRRNYENMPPSYLRFRRFNPRTGLVDIKSYQMERLPERPIRSLFWGAGFSFGTGARIREVPFDPHCPYVFHGEEIAMAARLWTQGYDFFHPTRMLVFHLWEPRRPIFGEQFQGQSPLHGQRRELKREGYRRLRTLLGINEGWIQAPYGLGTARTLADYEKFIGIDMRRRVLTSLTGLLGVAENSESDEVLSKFGSLTEPFSKRFLPP